jgi:AAA domain
METAPTAVKTTAVVNPIIHLYSPQDLDRICADESRQKFVVEGIISQGSVNIWVGDSGLGKSPLAYQMAIAVAAGVSWLGFPTTSGPVIYVDLENSPTDSKMIRDTVVNHLELKKCPDNFFVQFSCDMKQLQDLSKQVRPILIVIDSLRAFNPGAEKDNPVAAMVCGQLRTLGREYGTAFTQIHHIKKPDEKNGVVSLEDSPSVMSWLNQACGARALINQSDMRLGIDSAIGCGRRRLKQDLAQLAEEVAFVIRGHRRVQGEIGRYYVARCFDKEGDPIGYRLLSGEELLGNAEQQQAFKRLPDTFTFKQAKEVYGRQGQATTDFLKNCSNAGLLRPREKGGMYVKVAHPGK